MQSCAELSQASRDIALRGPGRRSAPSLPGVPDAGPRSATAATTIAFGFRAFSRNSLNARHRKISANRRHHHHIGRPYSMERVRPKMARTFARRYPDRTGKLRFLFPHRNLHYHQHRAQFDLLDFSALSRRVLENRIQFKGAWILAVYPGARRRSARFLWAARSDSSKA
jgi:hypothetical protein